MEEAERSYGFFERFLFYTLPLLFTLLLTGVLLTVFGYDVANELLRLGNRIPYVSSVLPEPKPTQEELREAIREAADRSAAGEGEQSQAAELETALAAKDVEIRQLQSEGDSKDVTIADLQAELEALEAQFEQMTVTEEEYAAAIRDLANVYANMSARRAASVLESLTLHERVLVLKEMSLDDQVDILERMEPTIAAETSILMKDIVSAKDLQIAALQERLALSAAAGAELAPLTRDEVSRTFAQMTPDRAAAVLLEMAKANEAQVIGILQVMEEASRATVLDALAELSTEQAARITARLG